MGKLHKLKLRLPFFIKSVFTLFFFVHATLIGYSIKYPDYPSTKQYTKDLNKMISFPLNVDICVIEQTNSNDRYSRFGYDTIWSFYKGITRDYANTTWAGWAGQSNFNSTVKNVEGKISRRFWHLKKHPINYISNFVILKFVIRSEILAAVSFDWARIVKSIKVINIDNKIITIDGKDIQWSFIPKYPACQTAVSYTHLTLPTILLV